MDPILAVEKLGFPYRTRDPFLACMHHDDRYPAGNERLGPAASLAGRALGEDFQGKDGWSMYHGEVVPGFPQHPHRGFETVTIVRKGFVDHADSLGATARYGNGDVQWLTAGSGVLHSEMFPLLSPGTGNPLDLFQIWLNLQSSEKMAEPYFAMFWDGAIPRIAAPDGTTVTLVAGRMDGQTALPPPPHSWAARPGSDVTIATVRMDPGARFTLPPSAAGLNRSLFFFRGGGLTAGGRAVPPGSQVDAHSDQELPLQNGPQETEFLLLEGRPIREPVAQYGPFVMNTREQLSQAFEDFRRTEFGGWRWPQNDPVHPRDAGRFARRPDGSIERPAVTVSP